MAAGVITLCRPAAAFATLSPLIAAPDWTIVLAEVPTHMPMQNGQEMLWSTDRRLVFGLRDDSAARRCETDNGKTSVGRRTLAAR